VPNCSGSMVHISPRTRNAGPQARIGTQSALAAPGSPAIIHHAELLFPRAPFLFLNACTTQLLPRQRIRLALRWVQPARIRVRPALRSRGVRTPLPLSAARTRPGTPFTIHAPHAAGDRRGNPPWLPDAIHVPEHKLFWNQRPPLRVNGANRVHRCPFPSPPSPRDSR